jgi:hypothetical protein
MDSIMYQTHSRTASGLAATTKVNDIAANKVASYRASVAGNRFCKLQEPLRSTTALGDSLLGAHRYNLGNIFMQFDTDGDGYLQLGEVCAA